MHIHCGRNRDITISVPPKPRVIGGPALPPTLPCCRSSGVHARCRGVYYSHCFRCIALHHLECIIWMHHLDVKTTFFNGEIKEDIYISQPEGFESKGKEDHILKLKKALYGLKQAPRACNSKLNKVLIQKGFVSSKNDYAVYYEKVMQESHNWSVC